VTTSVSLRRAGSEDVGEIAAVHEASARAAYAHVLAGPFPADEARATWRARLANGRAVVAEADGAVVGFAVVTPAGELAGLYVRPEWWRAGVGGRLLGAVAEARRLWVLEANASARAFYERHGWSPSGVQQPGPEGTVELQYVRRVTDRRSGSDSL
jgi:GNAT superfamily N-acetyltransferase